MIRGIYRLTFDINFRLESKLNTQHESDFQKNEDPDGVDAHW